MKYCRRCHDAVAPDQVVQVGVGGYCEPCARVVRELKAKYATADGAADAPSAAPRPLPQARRAAIAAIELTSETIVSATNMRRLGMVFGEAAIGVGMVGDIKVEARDLVGGRSATVERAVQQARAAALHQMREQALKLGADMVVAVNVVVTDFGGRGSAFVVTVSGTAMYSNSGELI